MVVHLSAGGGGDRAVQVSGGRPGSSRVGPEPRGSGGRGLQNNNNNNNNNNNKEES